MHDIETVPFQPQFMMDGSRRYRTWPCCGTRPNLTSHNPGGRIRGNSGFLMLSNRSGNDTDPGTKHIWIDISGSDISGYDISPPPPHDFPGQQTGHDGRTRIVQNNLMQNNLVQRNPVQNNRLSSDTIAQTGVRDAHQLDRQGSFGGSGSAPTVLPPSDPTETRKRCLKRCGITRTAVTGNRKNSWLTGKGR